MTEFVSVAPRADEDVARLYIEARVAGVEISHYGSFRCSTFDGDPAPGCRLGVFRKVGTVIFYKDERRWEARARADCGAVDLATLVAFALFLNKRFGRTPGYETRSRVYTHEVSKRTGKRIVYTNVCYRLTADDLLGAQTSVQVDIENLVSTLLD